MDPVDNVIEDEESPENLVMSETVDSEAQESAERRTRREVVALVDLKTVRVQLEDVRADGSHSPAERPVFHFVIEPVVPQSGQQLRFWNLLAVHTLLYSVEKCALLTLGATSLEETSNVLVTLSIIFQLGMPSFHLLAFCSR